MIEKLFNLAFRGYADDATFPNEAARLIKEITSAGLNPWPMVYVATAYARRGRIATALEILRYGLDHGRLVGRVWMTVWTPALKNTPGFRDLLSKYEAEENRRRGLYGRAS